MSDTDRPLSDSSVITDFGSRSAQDDLASAGSERAIAAPDPRLEKGLHGQVAQILNERELVINIGEKNGVQEGMRFAVLAGSPVEIQDPETGEQLGWLDREKVRVEAVLVMDRMSVCATFETKIVGGSLGIWEVSEMFRPRERIPKTLRAARESYPAPLTVAESYVKIGDIVRELKELEDLP
jgi:hypothetical protein